MSNKSFSYLISCKELGFLMLNKAAIEFLVVWITAL